MHAIWKNLSRRWRRHSCHRYCHLHCSTLNLLPCRPRLQRSALLWFYGFSLQYCSHLQALCLCLILAFASHLTKANNMIKTMSCEPTVAVWRTLLGACSIHGDVEMGTHTTNRFLEVGPGNDTGSFTFIQHLCYCWHGGIPCKKSAPEKGKMWRNRQFVADGPTGKLEQMIRVQKFLHKSKVICTNEWWCTLYAVHDQGSHQLTSKHFPDCHHC
jgi:hypothetical protein